MGMSEETREERGAAHRVGRELRRNAQKTVFDARQRLTSSSGTRASFDYELLDEYADSRISSALVLPLMFAILAVFSSLWVQPWVAMSWAALVAAANTGVVIASRQFRRSSPDQFIAGRWTATFITVETIYGIAWSLLATFTLFSDESSIIAVVMFALALIGIAANAVSSRTLPSATLMSTLPVTLTVAINLVVLGGSLNWSLAAVTIGAEIFFVYLARQMHGSKLEEIMHQAEKDQLINELEEAREMSDEARRHAEVANMAKSQFLASMSHELRTPLTSIIGNADLMELVPQSPRDRLVSLHAIQDSGRHLLSLVSDLVDISRIEIGKYELSERPVSLVEVVEATRAMMSAQADAKRIELSASYARDLPALRADERAVRQVVINLLGNAIKFTPKGGKVAVLVARSQDGGQLVAVRDNGPGIPEDEIDTVLSKFGQGSLAQKTVEQGAGLGLSIVQQIMERHEGRFDLFSKLRSGTEVVATFPKSRVILEPHEVEIREPAPEGVQDSTPFLWPPDTFFRQSMPGVRLDSNQRKSALGFGLLQVLIVEDDLSITHVIRSIVRRAGHEVSTAPDGETALTLLSERPFDCVLLDMNLPGIRGTEVKRLFDESTATAPQRGLPAFFAVTGDASPSQRVLYGSLGFLGVVEKPFDSEDILDALDSAKRLRQSKPSSYGYPPDFAAEQIEKLERALSPEDFAESLAQAEASLRGSARTLSDALAARDGLRTRRAYHAIAGTAGQYGLSRLADEARQAEENLQGIERLSDIEYLDTVLVLMEPATDAISLLRKSRLS